MDKFIAGIDQSTITPEHSTPFLHTQAPKNLNKKDGKDNFGQIPQSDV